VSYEFFRDGVVFLVGISAEIALRACIGFGLTFGVSDTILWIRRGFPAFGAASNL
jgi:hypothetical protein